MREYDDFLIQKTNSDFRSGFEIPESELGSYLFPEQKYIVKKAIWHGRFAIYGDCGVGKTAMQLTFT